MGESDTAEVVTQPSNLDEAAAMERVASRPSIRLKSVVSEVEPVLAQRRYKPFYAFDVSLTKRVFRGEDIVRDGRIVVDGLTDVSRPFTDDDVEEVTERVDRAELIEPEVSEEEALTTARSRRMQVQHRERGVIDMDEESRLVYKPLWLVELANGEVRVVDATEGTVFSDLLLG